MKKFENVPKALVRFYVIYLIGFVISAVLFVAQITYNFTLLNFDLMFVITLAFLGLFVVSSRAIDEYKRAYKKRRY